MTLPELLASLGTTADEVAATLLKGGARGRRSGACDCPVAMYLIAMTGHLATVSPTHSAAQAIVVINPRAVRDFIQRFDHEGLYPELLAP